MPLWTTYLSNWCRNQEQLLEYLRAFDKSHGVIPKFVMLNRGNNDVAPTKELLEMYKSGRASWEAYTLAYGALLGSYEAYDWMFQVVDDAKTLHVVLICFEKSPEHCHRRLLAERIKSIFSEIDYKGELPFHFTSSKPEAKLE
jgi:uncharacterized protein YeaO (DUF488 family)